MNVCMLRAKQERLQVYKPCESRCFGRVLRARLALDVLRERASLHVRNWSSYGSCMSTQWSQYLQHIAAGLSGREIAVRVGATDAKVSYWKTGRRLPNVAECIQVARAFGRPPLEALIGAGYLDAGDVSDTVTIEHRTIEEFSDTELAQELLRRAALARKGGQIDDGNGKKL